MANRLSEYLAEIRAIDGLKNKLCGSVFNHNLLPFNNLHWFVARTNQTENVQ